MKPTHLSILPETVTNNVQQALLEDVGTGDVSAELIPDDVFISAVVICKDEAILCGAAWFEETFKQVHSAVAIYWDKVDGQLLTPGSRVLRMTGPARALLTAERTALNFLQLLSGTATATYQHCHVLAHSPITILDTRKTIPGLRWAQKYAVGIGGGTNHRLGLWDAYMIKENHISALNGITAAVTAARARNDGLKIIVEVENLEQLKEALDNKVDHIMLDNIPVEKIDSALLNVHTDAKIEVSGDINSENLHKYAAVGVDYISIGALTKNVQAVNFSFLCSRI